MSNCPFWSTKRGKVMCYKECPMHPRVTKEDECPFQEITEPTLSSKDFIDEFAYSEDKFFQYTYSKKLTNY